MFPDNYGSDFDYDAFFGNCPEDERDDWCDEHQQRQTTCGPCHTAGTLTHDAVKFTEADGELVRAVTAHLSKLSVKGAA